MSSIVEKDYSAEAVMVTSKMLNEELDLVEGCRLLTELSCWFPESEKDLFAEFILHECETQVFPIGREREMWNPLALAEKDKEKDEYIREVKSSLFEACRQIVEHYSE